MTIHRPSQTLVPAALDRLRGPTMGDVLDRLAALPDLSPVRRAGLMSAVRTLCRGLGRTPMDVSAEPRAIREALARLSPATLDLSPSSFNNFRSLIGKAVATAGIDTIGVRSRGPLPPAWQMLTDKLAGKSMQCGLMRPIRMLAEAGVEPHQVDQGTADALCQALESRQILRQPRLAFLTFIREWNRARQTVAGWPQVELRIDDRRDWYVLPHETFLPSLRAEIDARLLALSTFSLTRRRPPLRPRTVGGHRLRLWELASAAVHAGAPAADLSSLQALVEASVVERALEWLAANRFEGKPAPHLGDIARMAHGIASDLVDEADEPRRKTAELNARKLKEFCSNLKPAPIGLAEKNRTLLKRFRDADLLARFVTVPERVLRPLLAKRQVRVVDAVRAAVAVAIEILLHAPIRIQNLHAIDLDRHYKIYGRGANARVVLEFPSSEVKNAVDLSYPLPVATANMIAMYRERFRPLLAAPGNHFLFPGKGQRPKQTGNLSGQIAKLTFEMTGIRVTAHQFRHISAVLYLQQNPGDYETPRRFLGHRKLETTVRFYCGGEGEEAVALWDKTLTSIRQAAVERLNRKSRRRT